MTTPLTIALTGKPPRVTILSQMPRDSQMSMTDTCVYPHQLETDGKNPHRHVVDEAIKHQSGIDGKINYQSGADGKRYLGDGNYQSKSAITGVLCKQVLAYVKWCKGYFLRVDASVMDSLGCWLCNRGISVYIDPV
jgi:hypothetical protein